MRDEAVSIGVRRGCGTVECCGNLLSRTMCSKNIKFICLRLFPSLRQRFDSPACRWSEPSAVAAAAVPLYSPSVYFVSIKQSFYTK